MPTLSTIKPTPKAAQSTRNKHFRAVEKDGTIAVLSVEDGKGQCAHCQKQARLFNSHAYAEKDRPVITACRACTIARAGGEEKVWIKNAFTNGENIWSKQPI